MKKSVYLLKSVPSEKNFKNVLKFYSRTDEGKSQIAKIYKDMTATAATEAQEWQSLTELIFFLDPSLNRKAGCWWYSYTIEHGGMVYDENYGWSYEEDPNNPDEYYESTGDPSYKPDPCDQFSEIPNRELDRLIGRSRKLKKILDILED